jgi:riboflavin biosynthesis pyrimidine reductase
MYNLSFTSNKLPYFIANFVCTIDGKVAGTKSPYWPIASRLDFQVLEELRAQVDVLIHGKNTALEHQHAKYLTTDSFQQLQKKYNKAWPYTYIVVSAHPDNELLSHLSFVHPSVRTILATTENFSLDSTPGLEVWRCGHKSVDLAQLARLLHEAGFTSCMVEGGPTLFGSFVAADLIDELFLTISPKLIGSGGTMLSLIEGYEFLPQEVKNLKLLEINQREDELYLRYKFVS